MTMQSSGPISIGNISGEFGGGAPHSISEYFAGGANVPSGTSGVNGPIPSAGAISLSKFYGVSKAVDIVINYLVVGSGGTALQYGGAGGGGNAIAGSFTLTSSKTYTVVIGAGGSASSFNGVNADAGLNGGTNGLQTGGPSGSGQSGGSQAFLSGGWSTGGGGGATGPASAYIGGVSNVSNGGAGLRSSLSGADLGYGGGGGGGEGGGGHRGGVGQDGGGDGCGYPGGNPNNNKPPPRSNSGGGGGDCPGAFNGASGIVVVSYAGARLFNGGDISNVGGNIVHTFNTSGTLSPL